KNALRRNTSSAPVTLSLIISWNPLLATPADSGVRNAFRESDWRGSPWNLVLHCALTLSRFGCNRVARLLQQGRDPPMAHRGPARHATPRRQIIVSQDEGGTSWDWDQEYFSSLPQWRCCSLRRRSHKRRSRLVLPPRRPEGSTTTPHRKCAASRCGATMP